MDFENTFSSSLLATSKYPNLKILTRAHVCEREHLFHKQKAKCSNFFRLCHIVLLCLWLGKRPFRISLAKVHNRQTNFFSTGKHSVFMDLTNTISGVTICTFKQWKYVLKYYFYCFILPICKLTWKLSNGEKDTTHLGPLLLEYAVFQCWVQFLLVGVSIQEMQKAEIRW